MLVAPSSVPMFAITWRSQAVNPSSPGPWYSTIRPTPPVTSWRRSNSSTTSLAETQSGSSPVSRTPQMRGILRWKGSPAMAMATSRPPAPIASMPIEPAAGVWESAPSSVLPGMPKRCW